MNPSRSRRRFLQQCTYALGAAASAGLWADESRSSQRGRPLTMTQAAASGFPALGKQLCLDAANRHPMRAETLEALQEYVQWRSRGAGGPANFYNGQLQEETREMFARLVNAKPSEIALINGTTEGENIVAAGLGLAHQGGNVVIDELGWIGSKFLYWMLERQGGPRVRMVRPRQWDIDIRDMERAIDKDTKLVSIALVSNINGHRYDLKSIAQIAHSRGAHIYADIIQAAGAVPLDLHAAEVDFAACATSKWLMGDYGFAFLYIREDLQGTVMRPTRFGARHIQNARHADSEFDPVKGAAQFDTAGSLACGAGVCARASLKYLHEVGVESIQRHVAPLVEKLQQEMPRLGYPSITPRTMPSPIASFMASDLEGTVTRLKKAFGIEPVTASRWEFTRESGEVYEVAGLRISPAIYNDMNDVDRLLNALD